MKIEGKERVFPGGKCVNQFREINLGHNDDIHRICTGDIRSDFGKNGIQVVVGQKCGIYVVMLIIYYVIYLLHSVFIVCHHPVPRTQEFLSSLFTNSKYLEQCLICGLSIVKKMTEGTSFLSR